MEDDNMKLEKDLFDDVIAYIIGEPGAMGANGIIECLNSTGEVFHICYLDEETSWEKIKECFDGINGFNGPDRKSFFSTNILVLGDDDIVTTIKEAIQDFGGEGGKIGFHFYGYNEKKNLYQGEMRMDLCDGT